MEEELKNAVIDEDKKIRCPVCGKTNGVLNEGASIKNYKMRCRGSRKGYEHFFMINIDS